MRALPCLVAACLSPLPRSNPLRMVGKSCDYLVVGAGASGMAFVDTLLLHSKEPVSVVLLDKREQPGGHWNDAYDFATLHQPARNYGVESSKLEDLAVSNDEKRATKDEILAYYQSVLESWKRSGHNVEFVGGATFDFAAETYTVGSNGAAAAISAAKKIVDARFTANDIPLLVPPRFSYSREHLDLIPPNGLVARGAAAAEKNYVVLGAGKTGQDTYAPPATRHHARVRSARRVRVCNRVRPARLADRCRSRPVAFTLLAFAHTAVAALAVRSQHAVPARRARRAPRGHSVGGAH